MRPATGQRVSETLASSRRLSEAGLPYTLTTAAGASHLVVFFPSALIGAQEPREEEDDDVIGTLSHRLTLGSDDALIFFRGRETPIAELAIDITSKTIDELGVDRRNVLCAGHSYQGLCALLTGFRVGAGRIVVAAPCTRLGSWINSLYNRMSNGGQWNPLYDYIYGISGIAEDEARIERLDRMLDDAAREVTHDCEVVIFVSPHDVFYPEIQNFAKQFRAHQHIRIVIETAEYDAHRNLLDPFRAFLTQYIRDCVGVTSAPEEVKTYGWASI
jgi:hypothetical protein